MKIEDVRQKIIDHPSNAWAIKKAWRPLYSASEKSRIVIIGQAPGRIAQETQKPWNDKSGDTLREWMGVDDKTFYNSKLIALIPMDFYFPGKAANGDLPPRKDFAPLWHPQLFAEMNQIELTLLIGQFSQKYYLDKSMKRNLTQTVRSYKEYLPEYFPLVHPSPLNARWQAKNRWFSKEVVPQLRSLVSDIIE